MRKNRGATVDREKGVGPSQTEGARIQNLEADFAFCLELTDAAFREQNLDEFMRTLLTRTISRLNADRGSIFIFDQTRHVLRGFMMTGIESPTEVSLSPAEGIIGRTFRNGQIENIRDAYEDPQFYKSIDQQTGYRTRAILCAPIRTSSTWATSTAHEKTPGSHVKAQDDKEIWGVIELLNPLHKAAFDCEDEASLQRILNFATVRFREHSSLEQLLHLRTHYQETVAQVRGYDDHGTALNRIMGQSPAIRHLKQMIWSTATYDTNVLVHGESGTGKELIAHCLHALSPRAQHPFVAINCASLPESLQEAELFGIEKGVATGVTRRAGRIEQAHKGTLFLDEAGEMSLNLQAKLLRVLQERVVQRIGAQTDHPVDVRIICATHRNLRQMVKEGSFREDLYYRLHVVEITAPPLRDRLQDIPALCDLFLQHLAARYRSAAPKTLRPAVIAALQKHHWPGNIRELQNEIERLFVLSGDVTSIGPELLSAEIARSGGERTAGHPLASPGTPTSDQSRSDSASTQDPGSPDLPAWIFQEGDALADALDRVEQLLVKQALTRNEGNKSRAAQELGVSREGLRKMLSRWGKTG